MTTYSELTKKIEYQHNHLAKKLDQLEAAIDKRSNGEAISEVLNAMTQYITEHFELEENAMKMANYKHYERHREAHLDFLRKTAEFCTHSSPNWEKPSSEITQFLRNWLTDHVAVEDREMIQCLEKFSEQPKKWGKPGKP